MNIDLFTIYCINRLADFKEFFCKYYVIGALFLFPFTCIILHMLQLMFINTYGVYKPEEKIGIKTFKCLLIILFIVIPLIMWLVPTREEMYTLFILSKVTPENIAIMQGFGVENFQQFCDAIANSIDKIQAR